jgi:hypothetical protein
VVNGDERSVCVGRNELTDLEFLLYNMLMGRPRGSGKNTAMVNGRISGTQMDWLLELADRMGGNLSAALRQAITDAQVLEAARSDYEQLRVEHPEFEIPRHDDDGTTRFLWTALHWRDWQDEDEEAIRKEESKNR